MKNIKIFAISLSLALLAACMSVGTENLSPYEGATFTLQDGYAAFSYEAKPKLGGPKAFPIHICKGEYKSLYKDELGTYFGSPESCPEHESCSLPNNGKTASCESNALGGIWVPNNPEQNGYDLWFVVNKSLSEETGGLVFRLLDALEMGNYKKLWLSITSPEIINEIEGNLKNND